MVHLLYFGRISDVTGRGDEYHALPAAVQTVENLRHWLDSRFEHVGAFTDITVRIAIDNDIALETDSVVAAREIALLPPVGGG